MAAPIPAPGRRRRPGVRDADRFLDELLGAVRDRLDPVVRDRLAHGLDPADRPIPELAQMMAAPLPRRSRWDGAMGPFYDTTGVCRLLGISRQALSKQRRRRQIVALPVQGQQFVYPTWQFDARRRVLPGLASVLASVPDGVIDDWTLASWLRTSALAELDGRSVVEHLAHGGDPSAAVHGARRSAARWAA